MRLTAFNGVPCYVPQHLRPFSHGCAAVAVAGDLNADGSLDLLIGAPSQDAGGTDTGTVYVVNGPISGTASLSTAAAARIVGDAASDQIGGGDGGLGVAAAGDVDGCDDVLVGVRQNDIGGNAAGAAYLIYAPC